MGQVVSLAVTWGNQVRLKCVRCTRYTSDGSTIVCKCGAVYQKKSDNNYEVVRAP